METVAAKKTRSRKRKRNSKNKRRVRRKLEVKATTSRREVSMDDTSPTMDERKSPTMEANSFWGNYEASQDWQQRHTIAWWKSRCRALEHENKALRQKIKEEARKSSDAPPSNVEDTVAEDADESEIEPENMKTKFRPFVFEVDQNMVTFLELSIRHKMEMKRKRDAALGIAPPNDLSDVPFAVPLQKKIEDARQLYGPDSPKIMAMEAALQATIDRHKDRVKPSHWPSVPLKP